MSIDLSKVTELSDQYGNIVQLELGGKVIWAVSGGKVILQVEKITSDTYAGETTYTGEQFILLDIYPKTNGTVKVTYGGLTKTITDTSGAAEPNAQQVFFGTFNGVSDSVATPASGTLTIEGGYSNFACGSYQNGSKTTNKGYCACITAVNEWGAIEYIPNYAFYKCTSLALTSLPSGITSIGNCAFYECEGITSFIIGDSVTTIGEYAFKGCSIAELTIGTSITTIGACAFQGQYVPRNTVTTVTMLAVTPPTIYDSSSNYTFDYKSEGGADSRFAHIIVPKGCGDIYKAADIWSTIYSGYITEAS